MKTMFRRARPRTTAGAAAVCKSCRLVIALITSSRTVTGSSIFELNRR
jgi:hypothetical protein